MYCSAEIVNCGFHIKSAFYHSKLKVYNKVVCGSFSHPYDEQFLSCFLFGFLVLEYLGKFFQKVPKAALCEFCFFQFLGPEFSVIVVSLGLY